MSTYRDKIEKYLNRLHVAETIGLEPREKDMKRLAYYAERALKKGLDHETKLKDELHWAKKKVGKGWRFAKPLVKKAAAVLILANLQ